MFYAVFSVLVGLVNAIFVSDRFFGLVRLGGGGKGVGGRLLELAVIATALMFGLRLLEASSHGSAYSQGWEFYAITGCVMLVAVFPGFVYRYLWKRSAA
ncbi:hypothetical protein GCM10007933_13890 [Zoogloea oryzae]|uniref:DUF2818 family protein n=1 Tax=Zoogloea oryzae TaxID=310767 RepID=A0ABQ6FAD7_9RHOO|nr:DUF2818 family protein [Zoogloea oryzae]GLT21934.1 hypothetical protein GCM10007933_13890 [Zoogloea oryzae]